MPRTAIFIDGGYIYEVLRHEFGGVRIDYQLLSEAIAGDNELLRTYFYHCLPFQASPPTPQQRQLYSDMDSFLSTLRKLPRYEVRLGKLARRTVPGGGYRYEQKRVDTLMVTDMVLLSAKHRIDRAVLVTGDSDMLPAVEVAVHEGVLVHLYHGRAFPNELWDACDERTAIDQALIDRVRR